MQRQRDDWYAVPAAQKRDCFVRFIKASGTVTAERDYEAVKI